MGKNIFISTGELSADIHAARLVKELFKKDKNLNIFANGGDNLEKAGAKLLYNINDISFMGFAEVIKHLPFIKKIFSNTIEHIVQEKIDLVILMDYPGFNLRLAKELKKRNIKVIYYISPQIWAWHQSRVKIVKKCIKKVLCILPFEPQWFIKHGVDAEYVGNPLMDKVIDNKSVNIDGITKEDQFIGLFPGSRLQELEKHLGIMIEAAQKIRNVHKNLKFVIAMAPGRDFTSYQQQYNFDWLKWSIGQNDQIMHKAEYLIMVSGTASLEAAIIKTPMIIIYKTSAFTYRLAKMLTDVKFIGLANLITDKEGIRELIQHEVTTDNIYIEVNNYLINPEKKEKMKNFYQEVCDRLGGPGASKKAAEIIVQELESGSK